MLIKKKTKKKRKKNTFPSLVILELMFKDAPNLNGVS